VLTRGNYLIMKSAGAARWRPAALPVGAMMCLLSQLTRAAMADARARHAAAGDRVSARAGIGVAREGGSPAFARGVAGNMVLLA
jgi:hypothetical protein